MLLEVVAAVTLGLIAGSGPGAEAKEQRPASLGGRQQGNTAGGGADGGVVDEAPRDGGGPGPSLSTEEAPALARIPEMPGGKDRATSEEPTPAEKGSGAAATPNREVGVRMKNSL